MYSNWNVDTHPSHTPSTHTQLQWPRHPRPGLNARRLWTQEIKALILQTDDRLRTPLGEWTLPVDQRDRH